MQQFYQEKFEESQEKEKHFEKRHFLFSWFRVILFLVLLGQGYLIFSFHSLIVLLFLPSLILFIALLVYHEHLGRQKKFFSKRSELIQEEMAACRGDFNTKRTHPSLTSSHPLVSDLGVLDPHGLFNMINRGDQLELQQKLLNQLLHPNLKKNAIIQRQAHYQSLAKEMDWCLDFRTWASMSEQSFSFERWGKAMAEAKKPSKNYLFFTAASSLLSFIGFVWAFINFPVDPIFGFLYIGLHLFLYSWLEKKYAPFISLLSEAYLPFKNAVFEFKVLEDCPNDQYRKNLFKDMNPVSQALKKISGTIYLFEIRRNIMSVFLLNPLFFYSGCMMALNLRWIEKEMENWKRREEVIQQALLDCFMATFRANYPQLNQPILADQPCFKAEEMIHPYLHFQKGVPYSFAFDQNKRLCILTGSNMAGKSTFVRALGINYLLAMNGLPVFAKKLEVFPFQLESAILIEDNIEEKASYFFAEIKRLSEIVKEAKVLGNHLFVLMDEILKGTNSEDKKNGSKAFVEKLHQLGVFGILATHDMDLTQLSKEDNGIFLKSFEVNQNPDGLVFDYQLRDGPCQNKNATFLMRKMGLID